MKKVFIDLLSEQPVSHNLEIKKRVLFQSDEIPHITQYAQTKLQPGQVATGHAHSDMWEIFLCIEGRGVIKVDGQAIKLEAGVCVLVEPGEVHEIENTSYRPLVLNTLGVVE